MSQADKEPGPSRGKVVVATDITLTVPIRARAYRMRLPFFARRKNGEIALIVDHAPRTARISLETSADHKLLPSNRVAAVLM